MRSTVVSELLAEDESASVAHPLCLSVSDGGELQRGGCSVSVQHQSLYTLFRSTHAHAGKRSHWCIGASAALCQS